LFHSLRTKVFQRMQWMNVWITRWSNFNWLESLSDCVFPFISSGDDYYDVCAICLEEYKDGERLRILPCEHGRYFQDSDAIQQYWYWKRATKKVYLLSRLGACIQGYHCLTPRWIPSLQITVFFVLVWSLPLQVCRSMADRGKAHMPSV